MAEIDQTPSEETQEPDIVSRARKALLDWEGHAGDWLEEAKRNYDVVAGRQWDEGDKSAFEKQNRPILTLNNVAAMVRAICGLEINSRQQVTYFSRYPGVSQKSEILSAAAKWVRDECNAEDEESECFRDLVICGMGFTETRYTAEDNPAGEIWVERLDPLSCAWDVSARKRGLSDAGWLATWRDIPREEIERLWPDKVDEVGLTFWPSEAIGGTQPHDSTESAWYPTESVAHRPPNTARVVQFQYTEPEAWVEIASPNTPQKVQMPRARYEKLAPVAEQYGLSATRMTSRKQYWQAIIAGNVVLENKRLPVEEFTIKPMTGIRDRNERVWYGFLRDLVDPQKFVNKMMSLGIEILSTTAKGGLMAESDAFVNPRSAEEDWANPKRIVWLKSGAIAKVQERQSVNFPPALTQLMQFSVEGLPRISGMPMEFLGVVDRAQAGVLEYQRRQSAVSGLAELFASLRLYRKQHGKLLAKCIAKYMNDGRLVRVTGPDQAQYVPLALDPMATEYDIVVDESPAAPDVKARTWAAMQEILPLALKAGIPIPPEILDYSPLPASLASKWKEMLTKAQGGAQVPPQVQEQMAKMGEEMQKLQAENQKLKVGAEAKIAALEAERQAKMAELAQEGQNKIAELNLKRQIGELEAQLEHERQLRALALERDKAIAELEIKREQAAMSAAIDREAGMGKLEVEREKVQVARESDEAKVEAKESTQAVSKVLEKLKAITEAIDELQAKEGSRKVITLKREGGKLVGATVSSAGEEKTISIAREGGKVSGATSEAKRKPKGAK